MKPMVLCCIIMVKDTRYLVWGMYYIPRLGYHMYPDQGMVQNCKKDMDEFKVEYLHNMP